MTPGSNSPTDVLPALVAELNARGIKDLAATGALAFGAWTAPRVSQDFDFCANVPESAVDPLLAQYDGIRVGPERIPNIVRFYFARWQVDIFVAKTQYDFECLRRAIPVVVLGASLKVVTPEDLLIHKLIKLRDDKSKLLLDASDIRTLVSLRGDSLDWAYVERWTDADLAALLRQAATIDEAELVARLKAI